MRAGDGYLLISGRASIKYHAMTSDADHGFCWHSPFAIVDFAVCSAESSTSPLHVFRIRSFASDLGLQHPLELVCCAENCFDY